MKQGFTERKCDECGNDYLADNRNLKRGWGLCCSKSCSAKKREKSKPGYDPERVERNNIKRESWIPEKIWKQLRFEDVDVPMNTNATGKFQGYTPEGYRIFNGIAFDEFDHEIYRVDPFEDSHDHGQWK